MDPERQPLLAPTVSQLMIISRHKPLTYEEVLEAHQKVPWRRARLGLALVFWATMAVFLSIIVSMLMNNDDCSKPLGPAPAVPPVHMSFTPLMH